MMSISRDEARRGGGGRGPAFRRGLLAVFALLWACALPAMANAACLLRVGWDEWPPYITYQDGRFQGLEYDLLKSTADAAGCELDMMQVPWVRAQKMLQVGQLDLLYGAGYSKERAQFARYSLAYRLERFVLVTKANAGEEARPVSLTSWVQSPRTGGSQRRLGVFRGTFYGQTIDHILKSNGKTVVLVVLNQNEQMIEMLRADRLDGYLIEDGVALMQAEGAGFPMRRFPIEEQAADPLHYMFSSGVPAGVIERFNTAIRQRQATAK